MNQIKISYGICIKDCVISNRNLNLREILQQGEIIRILEAGGRNAGFVIKLYNCQENSFKSILYECDKENVEHVDETLWLHMIGTKNNIDRMRIYNARDFVLGLQCGIRIAIKSYENDSNANIKGIIQLIGTVPEMGIGYFVGIRIVTPPVSRETYLRLYKNQYNQSASLFLFRIDQLLDDSKDGLQSFSGSSPLPNAVPTVAHNSHQVETNKFASNAITPIIKNESNNYFPSVPELSLVSSQRAYDQLHNLNNCSLNSNDRDVTSKIAMITTYKLNEKHESNAQLVDVSSNEEVVTPKFNTSLVCVKRKDQHNQKKKENQIPNTIAYVKHPNNNHIMPLVCNICRDPVGRDMIMLKCTHCFCINCLGQIFDSSISNMHAVCPVVYNNSKSCDYELQNFELSQIKQKLNQFGNRNLSTYSRLEFKCNTTKCNGKRLITKSDNSFKCHICQMVNCIACNVIHDNMTCNEYKHMQENTLCRYFENRSKKIISTPDELSLHKLQLTINETNKDNEILMKCKGTECNGQWFASVNEKSPLFKCPVCQFFNCLTCNVIHQNETCEEFQATQRRKYISNIKLDNEKVMKCFNVKCAKQWMVSKTDNSSLFKCSFCGLVNCTKCHVIHQNQTCAEFKMSNHCALVNDETVENRFMGQNWNCNFCTFENSYSFFKCAMCDKWKC